METLRLPKGSSNHHTHVRFQELAVTVIKHATKVEKTIVIIMFEIALEIF